MWLSLSLLAAAAPLPAQNALEIVRKSLEHDSFNAKPPRDYVYTERQESRFYDAQGNVTSTSGSAHEVMVLYGQPYRRLVAKNGKPLPADKERSEKEKLDREMHKRERESADAKTKREREEARKESEERTCRMEFATVMDFKLAGTETLNGRGAWRIEADPIKTAAPKCSDNQGAKKFHVRMWIDQEEFRWAKIEAVALETVTFGKVLLRAEKGMQLFVEQTRLAAGVWMPAREYARIDMKVALMKKLHLLDETVYSNYRKFQSDSRIVTTGDR